jgi:rhodanese-related sulfurtransferase
MRLIKIIRGGFAAWAITFMATGCNSSATETQTADARQEVYICLPCGQDCDTTVYPQPGTCPVCKMPLVAKSSVTFRTIQPEEICAYLDKHPEVVLLDVRTKEEFEGRANPDFGTLKNAINIPVQSLDSTLGTDNIINNFKQKPLIVYCSHSHRSPQASYMLTQHGFSNVTNMAGGMSVMRDSSCLK